MNKTKKTNLEDLGDRVFIALGANLGNPIQQLDMAALALSVHPQITRIAMSSVYRSKPHGPKNQPDFNNAVLEIRTTLCPESLLDVLQRIEREQGRKRTIHWGARTIDLDIILFSDKIINSEKLTIPHPHAHEREFVIQPLVDLDGTLTISRYGKIIEIAKNLPVETMEIIRDVTTYYR